MKRFYILFILLIASWSSMWLFAQDKSFIDQVSVEAGAGYNRSVSSDNKVSENNFAGFRSFYFGTNYEFTNLLGLRLTYSNNSFKDKEISSMGLTYHKFMAEATFNIIESIEMVRSPFEVVAHAGAGISLGKSKLDPLVDKMGTFQMGVMPQYSITKNISIHADAAYILNLRQNYSYDGTFLDGDYSMFNFLLGLKYSF